MKTDQKENLYCALCKYQLYYDGYICSHPEHPMRNIIIHTKDLFPFIYDKDQAKNCILFERDEARV